MHYAGPLAASCIAFALSILSPPAQATGITNALVLGSHWCSYSTNPSGSQTTLIFKFYSQGTYDLIRRTVGFVSGAAGVIDISGDEHLARGQWQVIRGELHMSASLGTALGLVATDVVRVEGGRIALAGPAGASSQC
jgi:hypothetical protein